MTRISFLFVICFTLSTPVFTPSAYAQVSADASGTQFSYFRRDSYTVKVDVQLVDANGQSLTIGGNNVQFVVPAGVEVTSFRDEEDGSYSADISSDDVGTFEIALNVDGDEVSAGSVSFFAAGPAISLATMRVVGNGNGEILARLNFLDRNINRVTRGRHDIEIIEPFNCTVDNLIDHGDGTYTAVMLAASDDPIASISLRVDSSRRYLNRITFLLPEDSSSITSTIDVVENAAGVAKAELRFFQNDVQLETTVENISVDTSFPSTIGELIYEGNGVYALFISGEVGDEAGLTVGVDGVSTAYKSIQFLNDERAVVGDALLESVRNANGSYNLNITLVDSNSNNITDGGDDLAVQVTGQAEVGQITDNQDGTYSAVITSPSTDVSELVVVVDSKQKSDYYMIDFSANASSSGDSSSSGGSGGGLINFFFILGLLYVNLYRVTNTKTLKCS